jgi:hypothetical protein
MAIMNSIDDVEITNEEATKLAEAFVTSDESFFNLLKNNTQLQRTNMKISDILVKYPTLDFNVDQIDNYFINVEKTTNGLLTPSKVIGTILAFYPNESENSKIIHDIAEKLLK